MVKTHYGLGPPRPQFPQCKILCSSRLRQTEYTFDFGLCTFLHSHLLNSNLVWALAFLLALCMFACIVLTDETIQCHRCLLLHLLWGVQTFPFGSLTLSPPDTWHALIDAYHSSVPNPTEGNKLVLPTEG